mgnify:CR=1 FL=1
MAEAKKNNYANIEGITSLLGADGIAALLKDVQGTERKVNDILKQLSEFEEEARKRAAEAEEARREAELKAAREEAAKHAEEARAAAAAAESEKAAEQAKGEAKPAPAAEEKEQAVKPEPPVQATDAPKTEVKPQPVQQSQEPAAQQPPKAARPLPPRQPAQPQQPPRQFVSRPGTSAPQGRNTYVNSDTRRPQPNGQGRPAYGAGRPAGQGAPRFGTGPRPPIGGARPAGGGRFEAPAAPVPSKTAPKKKTYDKPYSEQKRTMNKRALVKQQVTAADFDEDKSGYRKLRVKKQKQAASQTIKIDHAVVTSENIPLKVLSEKLGITAVEITKRLFKEGIMKTINDSLDYDTAAYIASDLGIELEYKPEKTAEELLGEIYNGENAGEGKLVTRPPVVTVMGHVDHGKTSLLDKIRSTNVTAGEAGGITQHIGAYSVTVDGKTITFLDTPGHEAFTAMRARGASVTDIVVLVVAADDGIMPQTVEAINHSKAADVPIIVAVNKIDKPEADVERVRRELVNNGLTPEEWGGDTIIVPVSAKTGEGIDKLLETINLVAEVKELTANPDAAARGTIIEAKLDKGKGPVASVLIQNGTLHTGDNVISGTTIGRVRAMIDDKGRTVKAAGPSMAVSILGLEEVPNAGDSIIAVEQDKLMKQVADERKRKESESMVKAQTRVTLDDVFGKIAEGKIKGLNIIVKGDVQGSVEAVKQSLLKLSNDEVRVNVLHSGAGAINESDIMLADSSNAIVVGFNVRPDTKAKALAERSKVDVRTYRIIYELLDDIQAALKGMLTPKYREVMTGKCDVLQTFRITGVGMVAGCYVTEGKLVRNGKLRIYRDDVMIVEGAVRQLKRFKDDVKEVSGGFECGVSIDGFDGIKVGDVIECYITEEIPA